MLQYYIKQNKMSFAVSHTRLSTFKYTGNLQLDLIIFTKGIQLLFFTYTISPHIGLPTFSYLKAGNSKVAYPLKMFMTSEVSIFLVSNKQSNYFKLA